MVAAVSQVAGIADPKNPANQLKPSYTVYAPITPSNTDVLDPIPQSFLIAQGGAIALRRPDGTSVTITVPSGYLLVQADQVKSTGTTATGITALY